MFNEASSTSGYNPQSDVMYVNARYDPEQEELMRQRQLEMQRQQSWDSVLDEPLPISFAGRDSSVDSIVSIRHDGQCAALTFFVCLCC